MNLFHRRLFPFAASAALAFTSVVPAQAQDAASAKATFDLVNKHLDLGGQFYTFLNVDGDMAALAAQIQELYEKFQGMPGMDLPPGVDIGAFLSQLGFDNIDAIGMSSMKFDKGYRNKGFLAVDGEPTGLLSLMVGESKAFEIGTFAPADAVLAMEMELQLGGLEKMLRGIGAEMQKVIGMDPISMGLQQPIPQTQLTVSQLINALSGQVMAFVQIDEDQKLQIPDPNAPEIPGIDLVLAHSNGKEVYGHIKGFLSANAPPDAISEEVDGGLNTLRINLPPQATLGFFSPVLQLDNEKDRLIIATRPQALAATKDGDRLSSDADFKKLADLLPKEGSGYSYASAKLYSFMEIFNQAAARDMAAMGDLQAKIMEAVYGQPQPMASVWTKTPDGIYSENIAPMSYKLSLAYAAVVPVAIGSAVMVPMTMRARSQAMDVQRRIEAEAQDAAADPFQ